MWDNKPIIFIEAKVIKKSLGKGSSKQLRQYFTYSDADFVIYTNGTEYQFYTDLDNQNRIDKDPFMQFNLKEEDDLSDHEKLSLMEQFVYGNCTPASIGEIKNNARKFRDVRRIKNTLQDNIRISAGD